MKEMMLAREGGETLPRQQPVRLIIVDDEELIRDAFSVLVGTFPEVTVVGEGSSGEESLLMTERLLPDLVLMDLRMPGMDGVTAAREIKSRWPTTRVIAVTGLTDGPLLTAAIEAELDGYILKRATRQELHMAITMAVAGRRYYCPEIMKVMTANFLRKVIPLDTVSLRESQVLELFCQGMRRKNIAVELGISIRTVEKHINNLKKKYQAGTTTEMVARYQRELLRDGDEG